MCIAYHNKKPPRTDKGGSPALELVLQVPVQQAARALPGARRHGSQGLLLEVAQLAVRQQRRDEDLAQRLDRLPETLLG